MFLANPWQPCMCKPSETDLSHKCFPLFIHIFYASQAKNLGGRIIACKLVNSILETTQKCSDYICIVSRLKETVLVLVMKKFGFCFLLEGCARKIIVFFHFLDMYINDSHTCNQANCVTNFIFPPCLYFVHQPTVAENDHSRLSFVCRIESHGFHFEPLYIFQSLYFC